MMDQARADELARRAGRLPPHGAASRSDESYWEYMQRQVNERTERLGLASDRMDQLEEHSSGWLDDVNKTISDTKKNLIWGMAKSKMGL